MNLTLTPVVKDVPRPLMVSEVLKEYQSQWKSHLLVGVVRYDGVLLPVEKRLDTNGWYFLGGDHHPDPHFTDNEVEVIGLIDLRELAQLFVSLRNVGK